MGPRRVEDASLRKAVKAGKLKTLGPHLQYMKCIRRVSMAQVP